MTPISVFWPISRDELKRAVDDVCSEDNRPTILHGPIDKWNVSQVTNMSKLFYEKDTFNYELSNWDVSGVTDMRGMFAYANSFDQDLSKWDVSRVTNMAAMFRDARVFNQDLSKWDVSQVINMKAMFRHAQAFKQDLSDWDVSRVDNMDWMFEGANSFQHTLCGGAWFNLKASTIGMFDHSLGSISNTECGAWMLWSFVCWLLFIVIIIVMIL